MAADWSIPADAELERLVPRSSVQFPRRFFRSVRLITRLVEALTVLHFGYAWPLVLAALACAVLDLRLSSRSDRQGATRLTARLLLDIADVSLWAVALHGAADVAAVAATPLAFEIGFWYGWRFLIVPLLAGTATMLALPVAGYPPNPLVYVWPAVWGVVGILAAFTLRSRWRGEARAVRDHIEAGVSEAELSGQNSVAMGADSVVDLLVRTEPLIASYERRPQPSPFSGWKATLAEACSRRSTYLGVALIRWQRPYNSRSPDLRSDVELRVRQGAGTLMLSPRQSARLQRSLEDLAPRGTVTVEVPEPGAVGAEQVVVVDGTPLTLPADPGPRPRPLHIAPFVFCVGAFFILVHALPQWEGDPLWAVLPLAGFAGIAAWAAQRRSADDPAKVAAFVLAVGLAIGGTDAVVSTALMRPGCTRVPFLFFLQWFGPLYYAYARDLRVGQRLLVAAGTVAAVGTGMLLMSAPYTLVGLLLAAPWLVNPIFMVRGMHRILDDDVADLRAEMGRPYDAAVREGFGRGRRLVLELTGEAARRMRIRYRALGSAVPSGVGAEIERRLEEAHTALSRIDPVG